MSEPLTSTLKTLRDVDGVMGSFVWSKQGTVIARDLPEYLPSTVLDEVGPRIERIYDAFRGAGDSLDTATLVYAEHKLHVRELEPAYVAVLSATVVNMPALKMALSLVGRRLTTQLASGLPPETATMPVPPPQASIQAEASSPAESPTPAAGQRVRYYRGSRVVE
jgi:predicted regulator of Ras-like GTPase activity (Roadblock/LC7/MglB family)